MAMDFILSNISNSNQDMVKVTAVGQTINGAFNGAFTRIVEMKIWRLLSASRKAEKLIAMASSYVCLTISTPEL
jgi:hypothetical protein